MPLCTWAEDSPCELGCRVVAVKTAAPATWGGQTDDHFRSVGAGKLCVLEIHNFLICTTGMHLQFWACPWALDRRLPFLTLIFGVQ